MTERKADRPVDDAVEAVIIRCARCEDVPVAGVPSDRVACATCGRAVWVSSSTLQVVRGRFPDRPVRTVCMRCVISDDHEIANFPEQVEILRALGDTDDEIAFKFAIADVAGGTGTLEDAQAEIVNFPFGDRAKAFPGALRRAYLLVRAANRPSN
jgi:ribosomal protein S27E